MMLHYNYQSLYLDMPILSLELFYFLKVNTIRGHTTETIGTSALLNCKVFFMEIKSYYMNPHITYM
jgi:hypothetical protein